VLTASHMDLELLPHLSPLFAFEQQGEACSGGVSPIPRTVASHNETQSRRQLCYHTLVVSLRPQGRLGMAFDVVSWALGWGLGKIFEKAIKLLTPSELSTRLTKSIQSWADSLPEESFVDPAAIFVANEPEVGPARRLLFQRLTDSRIPSREEWHKALVERWAAVRERGGDLHAFFHLPETKASDHLSTLAERLETVCLGDEQMFRTATAGLAIRIADWQQTSPVMFVSEIREPERYDAAYSISFYFHNASSEPLMVHGLSAEIIGLSSNLTSRTSTPGAPIVEYQFEVLLKPELGSVPLRAIGPRRFNLKQDETEYFNVRVTAVPGTDYRLRLTANVRELRSNSTSQASTPDFWLRFEA
jgi:hypothetical protein